MARRQPLTPDRIIDAAVAVADRGGLAQVSMRNVGRELGVEAMSLYHHIDDKEALLDRLADWAFTQIDLPSPDRPWRPAMADRAASARRALVAHPWALGLLESRRSPGANILGHHEAVLACLRTNGFSVALAAHAFSVLDAYVFGFVLTELNLPFDPGEGADEFIDSISEALPVEQYPHMVELVTEQVVGHDYAYGNEFQFGLDLILEGLEHHLTTDTPPGETHVRTE